MNEQPDLLGPTPEKKRRGKKAEASTEVAVHKPKPVGKPGSAHDMLAFIGNAARDPSVNPEKMRELLAIRSQLKAEEAKDAFDLAFFNMSPELPKIRRNGMIVIEKGGREVQRTPYARYEDLQRVTKPILHKHGFTINHKSEASGDGKVAVTAILRHKLGHEVTASVPLPPDPTGSKNATQAIGSALQYGRRYSTTIVLDLEVEGEDDDGLRGRDAIINGEQLNELIAACEFADITKEQFCATARIEKMADLPARRFKEALTWIKQKKVDK
jgi:hypothetical protein